MTSFTVNLLACFLALTFDTRRQPGRHITRPQQVTFMREKYHWKVDIQPQKAPSLPFLNSCFNGLDDFISGVRDLENNINAILLIRVGAKLFGVNQTGYRRRSGSAVCVVKGLQSIQSTTSPKFSSHALGLLRPR